MLRPAVALPRDHLQVTLVRLARWLEALPPFWAAFAMALTSIVGGGILALPIPLAELGPLAALVVLVALGLLNVLTITLLAEAVARSGVVRLHNGFLGRMVDDWLGRSGSLLLTMSLLVLHFVALQAFYIGFSTTLAAATGVSAPIWIALLFAAGLYVLRRKTLNMTATTALLVGIANIALIILLSLLALASLHVTHLGHVQVPFLNGQPFQPGLLQTVFGVVLLAYGGHSAVANCGRTVLQRDPSGRALLRGSMAAMAVSVLLYGLWTVAVLGAVPPEQLARESGTALVPLAQEVGPLVRVLGVIFVALSAGMATLHRSLSLFNLARERLPRSVAPGAWGRFGLGASPVIVAFVLTERSLLLGTESFTGSLSFIGVVAPLAIAIFPVLLLASGRRKGECVPEVGSPRWLHVLGNPVLLAFVYLFALCGMVVHGLFIWQDPLPRAAALLMAGAVAALTVQMWRGGAFAPRVVLEFRQDEGQASGAAPVPAATLTVTRDGRLATGGVTLGYPSGERVLSTTRSAVPDLPSLRYAVVELCARLPTGARAREVKVLAHQLVGPDRTAVALPMSLRVSHQTGTRTFDLQAAGGQLLLPWREETCRVVLLPSP